MAHALLAPLPCVRQARQALVQRERLVCVPQAPQDGLAGTDALAVAAVAHAQAETASSVQARMAAEVAMDHPSVALHPQVPNRV